MLTPLCTLCSSCRLHELCASPLKLRLTQLSRCLTLQAGLALALISSTSSQPVPLHCTNAFTMGMSVYTLLLSAQWHACSDASAASASEVPAEEAFAECAPAEAAGASPASDAASGVVICAVGVAAGLTMCCACCSSCRFEGLLH